MSKEVIIKPPKKNKNSTIGIEEVTKKQEDNKYTFAEAIDTLEALGFEITHKSVSKSIANISVKKQDVMSSDSEEEERIVKKKITIQKKIPKKKEEEEEEEYEEDIVKPLLPLPVNKDKVIETQRNGNNTIIIPQPVIRPPVSTPLSMGLGLNPLGYKKNPFGI